MSQSSDHDELRNSLAANRQRESGRAPREAPPEAPEPNNPMEPVSHQPEEEQVDLVKHLESTEKMRGLRTINFDFGKLKAKGVLTPEEGRSTMAEEFRVIKRPLLLNAIGQGPVKLKNGNVIMVTSALPKEGKTFTAINLALSLAKEMDRNVILIDGDVAKPSVARILGFRAKRGLIDFLLGDVNDLNEVALQTNVPKLMVVPSGRRHHNSTELLASSTMKNLIDELSKSDPDRIVVFDSPPLLATTEARELARFMGQIVMVVEAERTPQGAARDALEQLEGAQTIGLILNKSRNRVGTDYYYGYGGHYGGYGGYGDYGGYGSYGGYGGYGGYRKKKKRRSWWKRLIGW